MREFIFKMGSLQEKMFITKKKNVAIEFKVIDLYNKFVK